MKAFEILKYFVISGVFNFVWGKLENNVCKNLEDYYNDMKQNPNCWHNNDVDASPEKIADSYGLVLERHTVKTKDGFDLTTFRLKSRSGVYGKKVVFLQHGLATDSRSFMMNKNKSLPFYLSHQGYDVWLGNFRETDFSSHVVYTKDDAIYWNSSFHENALYDLPANFEYIYQKTKRKIIYIGHSMGGTTMTIYTSLQNREAEKYIQHSILYCCGFNMKYNQGLTNRNSIANVYSIVEAIPTFNVHYLLGYNSFEKQMLLNFCFSNLENGRMCLKIVDFVSGDSKNKTTAEMLPVILKIINNGSLKSTLHYAQIIFSGIFQMFDYGLKENQIRYGSSTPPPYNVSEISIPTTLVYGEDDYLATPKDNILAFPLIGSKKKSIHGFPHNHHTFLFSDNVDKTLNPYLLDIIKKYEN